MLNTNAGNLALAYLIAGWNARTSRPENAQRLLDQIQEAVPDAAILAPGLSGALTTLLSLSPFEINRCPVPECERPADCAKYPR